MSDWSKPVSAVYCRVIVRPHKKVKVPAQVLIAPAVVGEGDYLEVKPDYTALVPLSKFQKIPAWGQCRGAHSKDRLLRLASRADTLHRLLGEPRQFH